jgi:hypothetical protein
MSNPSQLGAIEYETEASWGVDTTTFTTLLLPLIGQIDVSGLKQDKLAPDGVYQRRNEGSQHILAAIGGQFTTKFDLPGHGSTTSGSPTINPVATLLGRVFGNAALSAAASTTLTGGTANAPTTTASATFSAGGLCAVGALGDGDGDGQFYPIATHITTTLTLLADLRGAPVNGAVLFPADLVYPSSSPTSASISGTRFRLLTPNLQYECHGCFPMSVSITGLSVGERPQIEVTWGVSWWRYANATFPSTVTASRSNPAIVAAGSLHVSDVGTATRNERSCRNFSINYTLGIVPLMGPAGVNAYQTIIGATRINDSIEVSWTEDADTVTTSPVLPGYGTATTSKLVMWTGSTGVGTRIGILLRSVCINNVAIQKADGNINRLTISGSAYCGATTTNDLTLAPFVMGWA